MCFCYGTQFNAHVQIMSVSVSHEIDIGQPVSVFGDAVELPQILPSFFDTCRNQTVGVGRAQHQQVGD